MAGIDEILNIIEEQQKQSSESIISAAEKKAENIKSAGDKEAQKAYEEYMQKAQERLAADFENSCKSADAEMKRRILSCRVECINSVIEKTIDRLHNLPDKEYFKLLEKIAAKVIRSGGGVISLNARDLKRITPEFAKNLLSLAEKKNGTLKVSGIPADIPDGFILSYGLISENCSFREIIETEKDDVRDTVSGILFGQVKK